MKKLLIIAALVAQSAFAVEYEIITMNDRDYLISFQATDPVVKQIVLDQVQDCFMRETKPELDSVMLGSRCRARLQKIIANEGYFSKDGCGTYAKIKP